MYINIYYVAVLVIGLSDSWILNGSDYVSDNWIVSLKKWINLNRLSAAIVRYQRQWTAIDMSSTINYISLIYPH